MQLDRYSQNLILSSNKFEKEKKYWMERLTADITMSTFPSDYKSQKSGSNRRVSISYKLPDKVSERLIFMSNKSDYGTYMLLLSGIIFLLHRYTGTQDIALGMPILKQHKDITAVNGILPLVSKVTVDSSFKSFISQVNNMVNEAVLNQKLPIASIFEALNLNHDGKMPFNTVVLLENIHGDRYLQDIIPDMVFSFRRENESIWARVEYNPNLYKESTVEQIIRHLANYFGTTAENPNVQLSQIEILSQSEKEKILLSFNDTKLEYSQNNTFQQLFEQQVENAPDKAAVIFEDRKLTYRELNNLSDQLAGLLSNKGVKQESIVGIMVEPSLEMITGIIGIMKAGGAYLPINSEYPSERIKYILNDSGVDILLTNRQLADKIDFNGECIYLEDKELYHSDVSRPGTVCEPHNLVYVIYTSGTTGKPKGVLIENRSLVNYARWFKRKVSLTDSDSTVLLSSFAFDLGYTSLYPILLSGGTLHIVHKKTYLDPGSLLQYISSNRISYIKATPSLFNMMVNSGSINMAGGCNMLRLVVLGGEEINLNDLEKFNTLYPEVQIMNHYGPTECTVGSIAQVIDFNCFGLYKKFPVIGKPIDNAQVYIVDKNLNPQPIGGAGEICIAGSGVARGYLNRQDLSNEKFILNPFQKGEKKYLYKTGDLGKYLADGSIKFLGRIDHQVKIRGFRIETGEVECQTLGHESVSEVSVTARQDQGGNNYLSAYFVADKAITVQELRDYLTKRLPDYMVPAQFTQVKSMPLTPNGKIDMEALFHEEMRQAAEHAKTSTEYIPPESKVETCLVKIWSSVLGIPEENIGTSDSFFEIGGNSILLIQMHNHIDKYYPGKIKVTDIFSQPTIKKLAEHIEKDEDCQKDIHNQNSRPDKREEGQIPAKDIAIIGISAKLPMAEDIDQFWENVRQGMDCIRPFPKARREDTEKYLKFINFDVNNVEYNEMGYMDEIDKFDYGFFHISPLEANLMDPNQRLFLQTAWSTIEDAGYGGKKLVGSRTGVYVGFGGDMLYKRLITETNPSLIPISHAGNVPQIIASRISYIMDFKGPSMLVDTACSSSLVALHLACQAIKNGECDQAIAGSVNIGLMPLKNASKIGIESSNYRARTFDDTSDGTGFGEGVGAILLKPLNKAVEDGDNIYAVIKGSAINQDGASAGITAPNPLAQEDVIIRAWKNSDIDPETISYIETHGTGTKLGDPIEVEGISRAFKNYTYKKQFCGIGSVKSNIGHLDYAPGIAGIIKSVMALKHREIPPTLHFLKPNRNINFVDSPVYVSDKLVQWETDGVRRRCGVSSFGLGGTNCHIVLEEGADVKDESYINENIYRIFTLSAKSKESLGQMIKAYVKFLGRGNKGNIRDICYTANTGRGHYGYRLAIVLTGGDDIRDKLEGLNLDTISNFEHGHKGVYYRNFKIVPNGKKTKEDGDVTESEVIEKSRTASVKIEKFLSSGKEDKDILNELCELYIAGAEVPWEDLYKGETRKKVSLPTYSFKKDRCWVEIPDTGKAKYRMAAENELKDSDNIKLVEHGTNKNVHNSFNLEGRKDNEYSNTEKQVAKAFAENLGFSVINVYDDFYNLGVDSIIIMRIVNTVNRELGINMKVAEPLTHPTIEELSIYLDEEYLSKAYNRNFNMPIQRIEEAGCLQSENSCHAGCYPASSSQKRIFILNQFMGSNTSYNLPQSIIIDGNLNKDRLEMVLSELISRHESFRTSFEFLNEEVIQRVHESIDLKINFMEAQESEIEGIVKSFIQPFDLGKAPLFRCALIKFGEDRHMLLWDVHHIIFDGTSASILTNEFISLYTGASLPELRIQYKDFTIWQNKLLSSDFMQSQEEYWLNVFKDGVPVLNMPTDFERPSARSFEGDNVIFEIEEGLVTGLKNIAVKTSSTLYMLLLSAYNVLLSRYTGQEDIVVGSPISGRHHSGLENIIGIFINTLAIRNYPVGNKTFSEFLADVRNNVLKAYENQDYQFEELVSKLEMERDESRNPLFDTLFALQNMHFEKVQVDKLKFEEYEFQNNISTFDLVLEAREVEDSLRFRLSYCVNLFERKTIERLVKDYTTILRCIEENQDVKIKEIELAGTFKTLKSASINDVEFEF